MKILQVFNRYLERGGEEKSVERIANHLEASGEELTRFWVSSEEWTGPEAPSKLGQVKAMFYKSRDGAAAGSRNREAQARPYSHS